MRFMGVRRAAAVMTGAWLALLPAGVTVAQPLPTVSTAATLTVLAGPVDRARQGASPSRAVSGTDLFEGDRILTGPSARALITFLDGSTVTVEPGSDVTVRQADVGSRERGRLRMLINTGTVWARVAGWLGGRSTVSLESNAYTAAAHDGLIGAQARGDGSFACWTRAGALGLSDARGQALAALTPGQKATVAPGRPALTEAFAVNQSTLAVSAEGAVLPLLVMPDRTRAAGFVEPGIEVNQVFGSLTQVHSGKTWMVEVPAGVPGPYLLVLTAVREGPYTVTVVGRFQGSAIYRQERRGEIRGRERLGGEITQSLAPTESTDARTARVADGRLSELRTIVDPLPVTVLLSPLELAATTAR